MTHSYLISGLQSIISLCLPHFGIVVFSARRTIVDTLSSTAYAEEIYDEHVFRYLSLRPCRMNDNDLKNTNDLSFTNAYTGICV